MKKIFHTSNFSMISIILWTFIRCYWYIKFLPAKNNSYYTQGYSDNWICTVKPNSEILKHISSLFNAVPSMWIVQNIFIHLNGSFNNFLWRIKFLQIIFNLKSVNYQKPSILVKTSVSSQTSLNLLKQSATMSTEKKCMVFSYLLVMKILFDNHLISLLFWISTKVK